MALQAVLEGRDGLLVPRANAAEAAVVEGLNVYPVGSLAEAVGFLSGQVDMDPESVDLEELFAQHSHMDEDFVDVKGQDYAKRALLIAAAGCHNVLMIGPPGTGKTLLAKRLPTILPPLTPSESLETTRIYSAMGRLQPGQSLMAVRPFCTPHHSRQRRRPGRRRQPAPAGADLHGPQGRALPRRDARVQPQDARGPPPAAGGGQGHDQPGDEQLDVSRRFHPRRRDEPLPLRLSLRPAPRLSLHAAAGGEVPEQDLRPAAGPDRPARRGPGRPVHAARRDAAWPSVHRVPRPGAGGPRPPGQAVRPQAARWSTAG